MVYLNQQSSSTFSRSCQTVSLSRNICLQYDSSRNNKSSQTELETRESKYIQAYVIATAKSSQTEDTCFKSTATQTNEDNLIALKTTPSEDEDDEVSTQDVQTIGFLNQIGEGLLSQNGLIQNNSTLLTKIADLMFLLKDPILQQNDQIRPLL